MQYLLTISTDGGDTVLSSSVAELTERQVAEIDAHFSEPAKDDETGPAVGQEMDEFARERLDNMADAIAEGLLSVSRDLATWNVEDPTASHTLAGIQRDLLKQAMELADLANHHAFETRRR